MKKNNLDQISKLSEELWRLTPARMAHYLSKGKFERYPHIELLSNAIARTILKKNGRLIITTAPRHGKSHLISRWVPVWFLSHFPHKNIILASYGSEFAALWGRQVRNLIMEFGEELKIKLSNDSTAADRFNTTQEGGMVTAGANASITGRSGDLLIIDDITKNSEDASNPRFHQKTIEWWQSTFSTRREPGASIIVMGTPWNDADLLCYLKSEENPTREEWEVISLPAICESENDPLNRSIGEALCPERYDLKALENIRKTVGSYVWSALYQQRPAPLEGNIVKRHWWQYYDVIPESFDLIVQSWDLTFKGNSNSDFTVGQVWGKKGSQFYLLDQIRDRLGFNEQIKAIKSLTQKWPKATAKYIEDAANGAAAIETLKLQISGLIAVRSTTSKLNRAQAISPLIEAGNVFLPRSARFTEHFIEEWAAFPNASNDDVVDSCSQGILKLKEKKTFDFSPISVTQSSKWI